MRRLLDLPPARVRTRRRRPCPPPSPSRSSPPTDPSSSLPPTRYDQVVHDCAIQKLPVRFILDRAGLVGNDGPTHHGAYDLAYLGCIPDMIICAPRTRSPNWCRRCTDRQLPVRAPLPRRRAGLEKLATTWVRSTNPRQRQGGARRQGPGDLRGVRRREAARRHPLTGHAARAVDRGGACGRGGDQRRGRRHRRRRSLHEASGHGADPAARGRQGAHHGGGRLHWRVW